MNISLVLLFTATIATSRARSIASEEDDNSVSAGNQKSSEHTDFVKITKAPPARVSQPVGSSVELECEAVGSPIPIVQWVHGSGQYVNVSKIILQKLTYFKLNLFTTNSLMTLRQTLLVKVIQQ